MQIQLLYQYQLRKILLTLSGSPLGSYISLRAFQRSKQKKKSNDETKRAESQYIVL